MSQRFSLCRFAHPGRAALAAVLVAFLYAWNQKYILDWDACFRAFTGFAARDLAVAAVTGKLRNGTDVRRILTKYSDYFEARPGSLVSYPPGQTAVIAALALISKSAFFLALVNVGLFFGLSAGMWRLAERFGFGAPGRCTAWATVCLHPTILLTVWSLRRGMFEAAAVTWFLILAIDYRRRPKARTALAIIALIAGGFLYRETLALLALPAAGLFLRRLPAKTTWRERSVPWLAGLAAVLVLGAGLFSLAEIGLAASGKLSIFSKVSASVRRTPRECAAPPPGFLTIWGYYRGQFGPARILGLDPAELARRRVPAVYRLARERWKLSLPRKTVFVSSSVFANPLPAVLLLILALFPSGRRIVARRRGDAGLCAGTALLYFLFLCPLGGIPDYVTPILPGVGVLAGLAVEAVAGKRPGAAGLLAAANAATAFALSLFAMGSFATGYFEEYPPGYDYDRIAAALLQKTPGQRPFGAAANNYIVKNLAFSKLRVDPENRLACYSLLGGRLPLEYVVGRDSWSRWSPWLHYRRPAPGVQWFVFRSRVEQEKTRRWLRKLGFRDPPWSPEPPVLVSGRKPWVGTFRPVILRRLDPAARPKARRARRAEPTTLPLPSAPAGQTKDSETPGP